MLILIQEVEVTVAQASISFQDIPPEYINLRVAFTLRCTVAAEEQVCLVRLNNDSGNNYNVQFIAAVGATVVGGEVVSTNGFEFTQNAANAPASSFSSGEFILNWVNNSAWQRNIYIRLGRRLNALTSGLRIVGIFGVWTNTAAVNRIDLVASAGNFAVGSIASLYGEV